MHHVFPGLELDLDAGCPGALGDARRVVEQDLGGTHLDEERRQTREVGVERRRQRVARVGAAQIGLRHHPQPRLGHHRIFGRLGLDRGAGSGEIGPRREQRGGSRERDAAIAQRDQGCQRQAAARGVTGDGATFRLESLRQHPAPGRDRIFDRGRERILRRQPVVDAEHPRSAGLADALHQVAVGRDRADRIAAAMQVEERAIEVGLGTPDPLGAHAAGIDRLGLDVGRQLEPGLPLLHRLAAVGPAHVHRDRSRPERADEILQSLTLRHVRLP